MGKNLLVGFGIALLMVIGLPNTSKACHGVALVGFSVTNNGSSVTVNANSDPATCGCGPYYMEVELACFSSANFTGAAPSCTATNWNVYPWYRSLLNIPGYSAPSWTDNCVLEPYNPITINFAQLCPGTQYVLRARERLCGNGSAGPWSSTYTFTTPGTPPTFILSATTNPTPASVCVGQPVTITATITGAGGCGNGTPTFTLNPGNLQNTTGVWTVSPAATTTYTITVGGGYLTCYPVAPVTVPVTINPNPTVGTASLTPPVVCQGGCVTLNLTGFTGGGTLQWQQSPNGVTGWTSIPGATTLTYVYCPVNSALYFRAMISNPCNAAAPVYSNVINVGIIPTPNVNITPANPSICIGQSVTLNGSGSPNSYNWSGPNAFVASTQNITVSPTVTTTYTLQTAPGNCPGRDSVTVIVNQLPVITFAPPTASLCAGDNIDIDAGSNANTYVWAPAAGVTALTPSQDSVNLSPLTTTAYNVTATSPQGCVSSAIFTLNITANPVLVLSDDSLTICPSSTDTLFMQGAINYTWSPPNGGYNQLTANGDQIEFLPVGPATYTVIGTVGLGCADTATVFVDVSNNIVVSAGPDDSICPGVVKFLVGSGATNYSWTASNSTTIANANMANASAAPTQTTDFYLHGTNQFGCYGDDTVTIYTRILPTPNAGPDAAICLGDSLTLGGSGGGNYAWAGNFLLSGGNTATPLVAPTQTTDYVLSVTDQFGCSNTDTVEVAINALPVINAGPDAFICGSGTTLTATGGQNYQWSPIVGLGSPNMATTTANPVTTTTYVVVSQDMNGCESSDSLIVTVYPPLTVQVSAADSICSGGAAPISAQGFGGDGGQYTYSWSPVAGLQNPNAAMTSASPTQTTTYVVTVSDQCGSPVAIDTIIITVLPLPVLTVTPDDAAGCEAHCVNFTGMSVPAAQSWTYSFGDNSTSTSLNPQHCYSNAGYYSVTYDVTDIYGCQNTITYQNMIEVYPTPIPGFTVSPQSTSILNPTITFTPNCINCDTTHYWMGDTSDTHIVNMASTFSFTYGDTGTFWVVQYVVSQNGCSAVDSEYVYIEPDFSFFAPNAFTPNGDGKNDVFYGYGEGIDNTSFEMLVYDRWGNLIFKSNDLNRGWDGRNNSGPLCQIDTYVWQVRFNDLTGNPHKYMGHINLIR
jgi:gliding motility-associated-like protein